MQATYLSPPFAWVLHCQKVENAMKKSALISGMLSSMLLLTGTVAQEAAQSSDPPNVTVVEKNWYKDLPPSEGNQNPFAPSEDYQRQLRTEKAAIKHRDESLPNQPTEARMPIPLPRPIPARRSNVDTYAYQIKVQNNGAKRITLVDWEYQFLDPNTGQLMGSRRIPSKVKIKPGETQVVEVKLLQQPAAIVNADQLDKKYRDQFTERVIIHRIQYADGTSWQRPATP